MCVVASEQSPSRFIGFGEGPVWLVDSFASIPLELILGGVHGITSCKRPLRSHR